MPYADTISLRKATKMKLSDVFSHRNLESSRPHSTRVVSAALATGLFIGLMAVPSLASASNLSSRTSAKGHSAAAITAKAPKIYLQQSGTGNKALHPVALPSKWYLTWKFNCGAKKGTFILTSSRQGKSSVFVNGSKGQTGLGGGGQQPYTKSGTYKYAIRTTCGWKVTASSGPLTATK